MSVNKTTASALASAVTVQAANPAKQIPAPTAIKRGLFSRLIGRVEPLTSNPLAKPKTVEAPKVEAPKVEPKKGFDPVTALRVQNLLKDTSRSTFEKLKSLLPIPESLAPIIDMIFGKKTKADVKVGIEKESFTFTTTLEMPGLGISSGTVILNMPLTAQAEETVTDIHPLIVDQLSKALNPKLSDEQQVKGLIQLLSTVPSQNLGLSWKNGFVRIHLNLPNGASLVLNLILPTSALADVKTPDILRKILQSILKENYAGIETLLSQDVSINWDGSTSRFDIEFPKQLALHINEITQIDVVGSFGGFIAKLLGKNSTLIIPKNIRGTVDFKNSSIQFDKGTTFITMGVPFPNVTINTISFDPKDNEIDEVTFDELLVRNYKRKPAPKDASDKKKETAVADEKKVVVNYEFIAIDANPAQPAALPKTKVVQSKAEIERATLVSKIKEKIAGQPAPTQPKPKAEEAPKSTVSVFESLKKMIKIPDALAPLIKIFFADQTKVDLNVGIEDNLTVSVNNLNIPRLGISGKASLSIPATVQANLETSPVQLHPKLNRELNKLLAQELNPSSLEEAALFNNLIDFALTMPNQNINMHWDGDNNRAQMAITLPGGMVLNLELNINKQKAEQDTLRASLLEALDSLDANPVASDEEFKGWKQYQRIIALQKVVNTVGENDFRRAELLRVLGNHGDEKTLRAALVKVLERDVLRTKLAEVLGEQFDGLEPFLKQTFAFNWDGKEKAFKITFGEQQFINLKSLKLKKGGFFKNMLRKFVNWMAGNKAISLPKEIRGKVNFEDASVTFEKGTTFVVRGPLGITKRVSLRTVSFARENMIDIKLRCFGTQNIPVDTTKSNVETASASILSRGRSVKQHQ